VPTLCSHLLWRLLFSSRVLCPSLVTLCSHKSGRCAIELYHAPHLWYPPFYTSPMASSALQHWIASPTKEGCHCPTLSNPVPWQNWMAAYLSYTVPMKTLFRGWPVMVHDTHTRRRRRRLNCSSMQDWVTLVSLLFALCSNKMWLYFRHWIELELSVYNNKPDTLIAKTLSRPQIYLFSHLTCAATIVL